MSVTYSDFLTAAKDKLLQEGLPEIELRSVIHQLYYGVYHKGYKVANELRITPLQDEAGSVHAKLRDFYFDLMGISSRAALKNEDKTKSIKISYILKSLHDIRVIADYQIDETVSACEVELFLRQIESCLSLMAEIKKIND